MTANRWADLRAQARQAAGDHAEQQDTADNPIDLLRASRCPISADYCIPADYDIDLNAVYTVKLIKNKDKDGNVSVERISTPITSAPCVVVGVLRDDDGEELVELAWRHYGTWRRRAVPREVVRSGRRLVTVLGGHGFPIMDSTAKQLEKWLDQVEAVNRDVIPIETIARVVGWQADNTFVTGDGQPRPIHPRITNMENVVAAHHPAGGLGDWQQHVANHIAGHPIAQMAIYAALAAPLLRPLSLDSFVVDFSGQTTTGKTTSLEAACSVWGDPHGSMSNWNATRVAQENRLSLARGVSVSIDETSNAERVETIRDMLYAIPQGRSKARGAIDGSRPTLTWQTIALTSGERSILSFTKDGGTAARVVEIAGSPFGPDGRDVAMAVRDGAYACYGTAGPSFVLRLRQLLADADALERLRERHAVLRERLAVGTSLNKRRAPLVAALQLAAILAEEWRITPFPAPAEIDWRAIFDREETHDDRPAEALTVVRSWVARNPHRLWRGHLSTAAQLGGDDDSTDHPPHQGWVGRAEAGGGFSLDPTAIQREMLSPAGFELDAVKGAWAETGVISTGKEGGKIRLTLKRDLEHGKARLMVFEPDDE